MDRVSNGQDNPEGERAEHLSQNLVEMGFSAEADSELQRAYEKLQVAYEELQVAGEELQQQNDELLATRQALEAERRRYQDLFQFAPDGYLVTDPQGIIRDANHAAERLLGLPRDRLQGKPLVLYLDSDEWEEFHRRVDQFLDGWGGGPRWAEWELRVHPHQGIPFPAALTVAPIRSGTDELTGLRWLLRDVTASKRAEERKRLLGQIARDREEIQELAASLERDRDILHVIMENTRTCLAYLDPEFNFLRVNSAYCEQSGHSREELLGRNHFELFPYEENEAIFEQVRDSGEPIVFQAKPFEYADQPERGVTYWDWTLVPVKDGGGTVQGLVFSLLDVTERIRAEQVLQASEERFRLVADYTYDWECWTSPDGENLYTSPSCERITGYRPEEFYDDPDLLQRIVHPDDQFIVREHLGNKHEGHHVRGLDFRIVTRDGDVRWINHVCQPVHGDDGTWLGYRSSHRDITERKEIEQEREQLLLDLEAERARLMTTLESAPEGIVVTDDQARIVLANPAAERIYARPVPFHQVYGSHADLRICYADGSSCDPRQLPLSRSALDGETFQGEELTIFWPDGQRRELLVNTAPILSGEGEIRGAVGVFQDVTERKRLYEELEQAHNKLETRVEERTAQLLQANASLRAEIEQRHRVEANLRASEEQLRQVMENIDEVFWLTDPRTGQVLYINPAYEEIWGRPPGDLPIDMGVLLEEVHPEDQRRIPRDLMLVWDGQEVEFRIIRPDGQVRWIQSRAFPIQDEFGRSYRLAGVAEDITEQKQALKALIDAEQLSVAGKMAASLAHEINNPLQAAMGCLELAQERLDRGDEADHYLEVTAEALERASRIVSQLRTLHQQARVEEKKLVDLNVILEKVLILTERKCEDHCIQVTWEPASDLPKLMLMPDAMQQVFLNLVLNALDAMPEGGQLRVSTWWVEEPAGIQVQFADDGVGISSETLPHLFEPFYTTKMDSLGLGLFISRNVVQQHDGKMEVESREGAGTSFVIWLPLQKDEAES